jgi:CheY-like chemotaxis protein
VDDEPDFRSILAFSYVRKGYQVLEASNGREAFDVIQAGPVDVVVSDIMMPGGDGIELLDRTKKVLPGTPVILLVTGFDELSTKDAYEKGAEALFSKPFDRRVLEETIYEVLNSREERKPGADRVAVDLEAELFFSGSSEAVKGRVSSLGRGGMFVTLRQEQFPDINETVSVKVAMDGAGDALSGQGIVRWVKVKDAPESPFGCGIDFTSLGESERKQVLDFMNSKKTDGMSTQF